MHPNNSSLLQILSCVDTDVQACDPARDVLNIGGGVRPSSPNKAATSLESDHLGLYQDLCVSVGFSR